MEKKSQLPHYKVAVKRLKCNHLHFADDDGDGVAEEDCATPPPSKIYSHFKSKYILKCILLNN